MADLKKWFKVWSSILIDPDHANMSIQDVGRWTRLGALLVSAGDHGMVKIKPPAKAFLLAMECATLDDAKRAILRLPNVQIEEGKSDNDGFIVTMQNWHKYQVDSTSYERLKRSRHKRRGEERREEKRREEENYAPPKNTKKDSVFSPPGIPETAQETKTGRDSFPGPLAPPKVAEPATANQPQFDFEKLWFEYPQPIGRKAAEKHFHETVKNYVDWRDIWTALENYKKHLMEKDVDAKFIQYGATWFANWRDWIKPKENPNAPDERPSIFGLPNPKVRQARHPDHSPGLRKVPSAGEILAACGNPSIPPPDREEKPKEPDRTEQSK